MLRVLGRTARPLAQAKAEAAAISSQMGGRMISNAQAQMGGMRGVNSLNAMRDEQGRPLHVPAGR